MLPAQIHRTGDIVGHTVYRTLSALVRGISQLENPRQDIDIFKGNLAGYPHFFTLCASSDLLVELVLPDWSLSGNCCVIVTRIFFSGIASPLSASMIAVMNHPLITLRSEPVSIRAALYTEDAAGISVNSAFVMVAASPLAVNTQALALFAASAPAAFAIPDNSSVRCALNAPRLAFNPARLNEPDAAALATAAALLIARVVGTDRGMASASPFRAFAGFCIFTVASSAAERARRDTCVKAGAGKPP
jgi:hypothetical protein